MLSWPMRLQNCGVDCGHCGHDDVGSTSTGCMLFEIASFSLLTAAETTLSETEFVNSEHENKISILEFELPDDEVTAYIIPGNLSIANIAYYFNHQQPILLILSQRLPLGFPLAIRLAKVMSPGRSHRGRHSKGNTLSR